MKPPICAPCQDEQGRWLNTKPSQVFPTFGIAYGSGAPYDITPAAIRDRANARREKWSTLVREQMGRIAEHCRAAGHVTPAVVPAVVQLDLFELIGGPT